MSYHPHEPTFAAQNHDNALKVSIWCHVVLGQSFALGRNVNRDRVIALLTLGHPKREFLVLGCAQRTYYERSTVHTYANSSCHSGGVMGQI